MFAFLCRLRPAAGQGAPVAATATAAPRADADSVLRRLEWTVIRRLDGVLQGDYRTLFRGFGLDFADLREYQSHDDARFIDWNVTARLQIPHVRKFQEDREVAAWFLLDLSASVDFGSQSRRKRALLVEFVAVLARLLTRRGNRVGAVLYAGGEGIEATIPARGGRRHVLHLIDRSLKTGEASAAAPAGRETDLGRLLGKAQQVIGGRSIVFVVSDFISAPGWGRSLALLARRHDVVAVRLYDPLESELPDLGMIQLQDAETGEQLLVDTHDRGFRDRFADVATRREQELRDALTRAGVDCLELGTGESIDEALLQFTRMRKRRSQLAAGTTQMRPADA